jgi:hypothetical protein
MENIFIRRELTTFYGMEDGDDGGTEDDDEALSDSILDEVDEDDNLDSSKTSPVISKIKSRTRNAASISNRNLGPAYNSIRAARKAASCLRNLNPTPVQHCVVSVRTGSFLPVGDERIRLTHIEHNFRARISTSLSFDPRTGKYDMCLAGRDSAFEAVGGGPVIILVADQAFPACLPARTAGKECPG